MSVSANTASSSFFWSVSKPDPADPRAKRLDAAAVGERAVDVHDPRTVAGFATTALLTGLLGALAVTGIRRLVQTGLDQPVDCPYGAMLCRCGGVDMTCAGPAPLLRHTCVEEVGCRLAG